MLTEHPSWEKISRALVLRFDMTNRTQQKMRADFLRIYSVLSAEVLYLSPETIKKIFCHLGSLYTTQLMTPVLIKKAMEAFFVSIKPRQNSIRHWGDLGPGAQRRMPEMEGEDYKDSDITLGGPTFEVIENKQTGQYVIHYTTVTIKEFGWITAGVNKIKNNIYISRNMASSLHYEMARRNITITIDSEHGTRQIWEILGKLFPEDDVHQHFQLRENQYEGYYLEPRAGVSSSQVLTLQNELQELYQSYRLSLVTIELSQEDYEALVGEYNAYEQNRDLILNDRYNTLPLDLKDEVIASNFKKMFTLGGFNIVLDSIDIVCDDTTAKKSFRIALKDDRDDPNTVAVVFRRRDHKPDTERHTKYFQDTSQLPKDTVYFYTDARVGPVTQFYKADEYAEIICLRRDDKFDEGSYPKKDFLSGLTWEELQTSDPVLDTDFFNSNSLFARCADGFLPENEDQDKKSASRKRLQWYVGSLKLGTDALPYFHTEHWFREKAHWEWDAYHHSDLDRVFLLLRGFTKNVLQLRVSTGIKALQGFLPGRTLRVVTNLHMQPPELGIQQPSDVVAVSSSSIEQSPSYIVEEAPTPTLSQNSPIIEIAFNNQISEQPAEISADSSSIPLVLMDDFISQHSLVDVKPIVNSSLPWFSVPRPVIFLQKEQKKIKEKISCFHEQKTKPLFDKFNPLLLNLREKPSIPASIPNQVERLLLDIAELQGEGEWLAKPEQLVSTESTQELLERLETVLEDIDSNQKGLEASLSALDGIAQQLKKQSPNKKLGERIALGIKTLIWSVAEWVIYGALLGGVIGAVVGGFSGSLMGTAMAAAASSTIGGVAAPLGTAVGGVAGATAVGAAGTVAGAFIGLFIGLLMAARHICLGQDRITQESTASLINKVRSWQKQSQSNSSSVLLGDKEEKKKEGQGRERSRSRS